MRNPKHQKYMEDFLFSVSADFIDTSTGEIFSHCGFKKPLSQLSDEDILKYFRCLLRGTRQKRNIALNISICKDSDLPEVKQLYCF